jgi:chemotaxis receptor (MCP) glutamine deamidase CheD
MTRAEDQCQGASRYANMAISSLINTVTHRGPLVNDLEVLL